MASKSLKFVGQPGEQLKVQQRGSQDVEANGPPEVYFDDHLDAKGEAVFQVPAGSILVAFSRLGQTRRIEVGTDSAPETITL
jgi:hypothetical protein